MIDALEGEKDQRKRLLNEITVITNKREDIPIHKTTWILRAFWLVKKPTGYCPGKLKENCYILQIFYEINRSHFTSAIKPHRMLGEPAKTLQITRRVIYKHKKCGLCCRNHTTEVKIQPIRYNQDKMDEKPPRRVNINNPSLQSHFYSSLFYNLRFPLNFIITSGDTKSSATLTQLYRFRTWKNNLPSQ